MKFLVMDVRGHTTTEYEPTGEDLARAERDFNALVADGRTAFALAPGAEPELVRDFPADAEEVLFLVPLVGG
jgi:hypothetical protein